MRDGILPLLPIKEIIFFCSRDWDGGEKSKEVVEKAVSAATLLENFDFPDNFELVEVEQDTIGERRPAPPVYEYDDTDARVISAPQGPGENDSKTFHGPGGATPGSFNAAMNAQNSGSQASQFKPPNSDLTPVGFGTGNFDGNFWGDIEETASDSFGDSDAQNFNTGQQQPSNRPANNKPAGQNRPNLGVNGPAGQNRPTNNRPVSGQTKPSGQNNKPLTGQNNRPVATQNRPTGQANKPNNSQAQKRPTGGSNNNGGVANQNNRPANKRPAGSGQFNRPNAANMKPTGQNNRPGGQTAQTGRPVKNNGRPTNNDQQFANGPSNNQPAKNQNRPTNVKNNSNKKTQNLPTNSNAGSAQNGQNSLDQNQPANEIANAGIVNRPGNQAGNGFGQGAQRPGQGGQQINQSTQKPTSSNQLDQKPTASNQLGHKPMSGSQFGQQNDQKTQGALSNQQAGK